MGNGTEALDAAKNSGNNKAGAVIAKCPAKIVAVEFLDADDNTELAATGKQFVNFPRDEKWVDGTHVLNIDRLSQKTRVKVRFDQPGSHHFKIKYEPDSSNVTYSASEKSRNNNFNFQESEKQYTTEADGTKIISTDFFVTAAGKDKYKLTAEDDHGNVVTSHTIETHRLVYYQEIKMKGMTSAASNLSKFKSEFAKHNITLISLGSVEMEHMPNIGTPGPFEKLIDFLSPTSDIAIFKDRARTAYNNSSASVKEPYVVAIAYTDHLAVKEANRRITKTGIEVGPGQTDIVIPIIDGSGNREYLWKNIVPNEDWFVSISFTPDSSWLPDFLSSQNIPKANCTAISTTNPDKCNRVKIKVSDITKEKVKGTIVLTVNVVNRMRGGLSFAGENLICVCTRAWWGNIPNDYQNQVLIHEMGHKIGMVPDGTGKLPDKTSKHYANKGHVGNHCHQGLAVLTNYRNATGSTCVMFGATNGKIAFCSDCTPALRKVDLSDGWSAF